jgi:hypothetical protein
MCILDAEVDGNTYTKLMNVDLSDFYVASSSYSYLPCTFSSTLFSNCTGLFPAHVCVLVSLLVFSYKSFGQKKLLFSHNAMTRNQTLFSYRVVYL